MEYVLPYIILLVGFGLLVKGADVFVDGSSGIARYFKIPSLIIGLTIVAFGTSAPEAAVSITASITGQNGIAVGNITGSCIFNTLVVLGVCSIIHPITVERSIMNKDYLLMLVAGGAFFAVSADVWLSGADAGQISRGDGILLALLFCIFLYMTIRSGLKGKQEAETPERILQPAPAEPLKKKEEKSPKLIKSIIMAVLGLAGVVVGGQMVVNGASDIAKSFGASETLIGLTVVAIGTSLPELVTSIMAARKGEQDIAVGNVVGSNLFNILFIISSSAIISPLSLDIESLIDILIMIGVSIMVYFFAVTKQKINRAEGAIMTAMYIAYTAYAIIR